MESDKFIDNIDNYLIVRRDHYTPEQILICRSLKEEIFSDEPYGIGDRDLFDIEQISLQDSLESLNTRDHDHMIFFDLVYFYRTGEIDDCTDRKEYIICGLFNMFITLMRARLQDVLGVPEVVFTVCKDKQEIVMEEWQDAEDISRDFEGIMSSVNIEDTPIEDLRAFVEKVKNDQLFNVSQSIEYQTGRSDVVCCDDNLIVRDRLYNLRTVLNYCHKGVVPILPWLVFNSMTSADLSYYISVCKGVYGLYRQKEKEIVRDVKPLDLCRIPPRRDFAGGLIYCSRHKCLFCTNFDLGKDSVYDILNSIYVLSDFELIRVMCYQLTRRQRALLYRMVVGRDQYQCVAIILTFLYLMFKKYRCELSGLISRYKNFYRLGVLLMKRCSVGHDILMMIDNTKFTISFSSRLRQKYFGEMVPSRICAGSPIAAVYQGHYNGYDLCRVKYPIFKVNNTRVRQRLRKKRINKNEK